MHGSLLAFEHMPKPSVPSESMMTKRLFVGGLGRDVSTERLQEAFAPFGSIVETEIVHNHKTGHSRGFGYVSFADSKEAEAAVKQMNGADLDGHQITVSAAKQKPSESNASYDFGSQNKPRRRFD